MIKKGDRVRNNAAEPHLRSRVGTVRNVWSVAWVDEGERRMFMQASVLWDGRKTTAMEEAENLVLASPHYWREEVQRGDVAVKA